MFSTKCSSTKSVVDEMYCRPKVVSTKVDEMWCRRNMFLRYEFRQNVVSTKCSSTKTTPIRNNFSAFEFWKILSFQRHRHASRQFNIGFKSNTRCYCNWQVHKNLVIQTSECWHSETYANKLVKINNSWFLSFT